MPIRDPKPDRVRVLIVLPADPERMRIGGIASFVRGFVKFAPDDFDLGFVGVTATRPLWRWQRVELEDRALHFLPVAGVRSDGRGRVPIALRFALALLTHRRRWKVDGWVASFHRPASDLPFRGRAIPMWRVVHLPVEDLGTSGSESRWRRMTSLLEAVERRSFRRMDRIYVVNERASERYRRRFPEVADRIAFLPNWADSTIFHPEPATRRAEIRGQLVRDLQLPADGPLVLFAGRLEGQKDPPLLAAAFAAFHTGHPAARLLVAGDGTLRGQFERDLASRGVLDAVHLLGTVSRERLAELMHGSDVLLITSGFETGPTVGIEALACGLPVVTTDVGEVARLVERSGAGSVAPNRDAQDLAQGLEWVLNQPLDVMRGLSEAAAAPYLAGRVLDRLYEDNRLLAERGRAGTVEA
jgi:glycosyltransferase involved in cell wall biosynthesis